MIKIASFQFTGTENISSNTDAVIRGAEIASAAGVDLMLTQECAICGYPPIERDNCDSIDFSLVQISMNKLQEISNRRNIYIALGMVKRTFEKYYNCISLISPKAESRIIYSKRALWGWDKENFHPGCVNEVVEIKGFKIGFRICFEIRFPEYFRELYREQVDIVCVPFNDTSEVDNAARYELLKSHILTRAVENSFVVVTSNTCRYFQTAPSCIVDQDGK